MNNGKCKHFNGIQNKECKAGLNIREVVGGDNVGWLRRAPCLRSNGCTEKCSQYAELTPEERAAKDAEFEIMIERMRLTLPIIKKAKKELPDGGSCELTCPVCSGIVHIAVAKCNLHTHGICETEGCLRWME